MSIHNLCFEAKIRKIARVCYIKMGFKGVYITRTCFCDDSGNKIAFISPVTQVILRQLSQYLIPNMVCLGLTPP